MEIEKRIPLGVLTYQRSEYLEITLESFFNLNYECREMFSPVVVLVQGADSKTLDLIYGKFGIYVDKVIELKSNHGCSWGYTLLNQELLEEGTDLIMHLQDDWISTEPITHYLGKDNFSNYEGNKGIYQLFEEREDVGYIRLRSSYWSKVCTKNRISRKGIKWRRWGTKFNKYTRLHIGNAHYTFNPTIVRTSVLKKILPVVGEKDAMEKYHKLNLLAAHLRSNCFMHIGHDRAVTEIKEGKRRWIK